VYRFQVCQLVVVGVDTRAEKQSGVSSVDDLVVAELDEIGLVFLVARRDEAVDFAFEFDLFVVAVGDVPFGEARFASWVGVCQRIGKGLRGKGRTGGFGLG